MKILHVITSLNRGGAENHLVDLAISQKLIYKHDVKIVFWKGNCYWVNYLKKYKIDCYHLNQNKKKIEKNLFFNFFFCFLRLRNIIKKNFTPNVIHAHLPFSELITRLAITGNKKIKFIISKHINTVFLCKDNSRRSLVGRFLEIFVSLRAHKIISISDAVRNFMINNVGIDKKKLITVHYGIKNLRFNTKFNKKNKTFRKKKNFLYIGSLCRLVPQKRVDILLSGFAKYNLKINNRSKLCIAGDGILKNELIILAKKLKIEDNVIWLGNISNVSNFLKKIDIFCLTSDHEGFGIVLLEAMLFDKLIIATRTSSIPEIIKHNFNGLLIPKNNSNSLYHTLNQINTNKNKKIFLKKNSKYILKKKFDLSIMVEKINRIYQS